MARFKARGLGLVTVLALAIGIATLALWQDHPQTAQAAEEGSTYVVEGGDSLYSIADKLGIDTATLASANGMAVNAPLFRGLVLTIPARQSTSGAAPDAQAASDEASTAAMQHDATAEPTEEMAEEMAEEATPEATEEMMEEAAEEAAEPAMAPAASAPRTYRVQAGDSLLSIAKELGVPREALAAANGLDPNAGLFRGQSLIIPGTGSPAAPAAPPSSAPEATEEAMTEEVTPEATDELAEEEATPEATEEMMDEEATAEATEEMMEEEATPEATEEAMAEDEATPEATEEMMEEEATPEATEEMAGEEATPEATEEMMEEEATPEATEEMMEEEATPEATEEMMEEEATPEPTEEMAEAGNLLDTITEAGDFTILLEALEVAGLSETLTTEGPFTLFAPTDAAFEALPAGSIDGLLASSPDDLSQILLYHLLPGEVLSSDFVDGVTVITAQGGTIVLGVNGDELSVNGAIITTRDIETSNGVIHIIDAVLLPSNGTAAAPPGVAAVPQPEAASMDAASVIIVPATVEDRVEAAREWPRPDASIALYTPVADGGYHSPLNIIGLAQTFGGHVAINLTTPDGTVLAQRMTLGGEEDYAFFQSALRFYVDEATEATLSVHEIDLAEGTLLHTVEVPVTLLPGQTFLDVNSPAVGAAVCDPILISAYSNTFEANVVLTLYTPDGELITQQPTIGGGMGFYRDFATPLPYPDSISSATPLLVGVTETDASGMLATVDEARIPITLYPAYSAVCY